MAKQAKKQKPSRAEIEWPFGPRNYIIFGVALVIIIIGYILLAQGSITAAPLLLVIGYCVVIPVAILTRDPSRKQRTEPPPEAPPAE
jgi:Flp pilus assembly protein TadB